MTHRQIKPESLIFHIITINTLRYTLINAEFEDLFLVLDILNI